MSLPLAASSVVPDGRVLSDHEIRVIWNGVTCGRPECAVHQWACRHETEEFARLVEYAVIRKMKPPVMSPDQLAALLGFDGAIDAPAKKASR